MRCCPRGFLEGKASAACALIADRQFSGGNVGPSDLPRAPEAALDGVVAEVADVGDRITIDVPRRDLTLEVSDAELATRRNQALARSAPLGPPTVPGRCAGRPAGLAP